MTMTPPAPDRRVLAGIGLVCFANVLLEVVLTRIFSATMYYHFTFLSIALALFGLGASGVFVYLHPERYPPERVRADLAASARRFAGFTVLALVYVLANPIDVIQGKLSPGADASPFSDRTLLQLILLNGFAALPFFHAGMVVSLAVAHYREHIDRVYAWDLAGAGMAALLAGVLLSILGAPSLVLAIAVFAALATLLFERPRGWAWWPQVACVGLLAANLASPFIRVPSVKGVDNRQIVFEKWNAFSRVTVDRDGPKSLMIRIDASANTHLYDAAIIPRRVWGKEITALAHALFPGGTGHALVIGPGGGHDVVNGLAAGAKKITGVEVNPIIAREVMQERFVRESGGLYADPRVRIVVDDGRSFIRRSEERYDIIQATLVDTWAATAAGAFALSENTLYTREAFEDYLGHLSERGVVTMTRWHTWNDPESLRLVVLASAALERLGVAPGDLRRHLFFATVGSLGTLIVGRAPFSEDDAARLAAACRAGGFDVVLTGRAGPDAPGSAAERTGLGRLVDGGSKGAAVRENPKDLSPPTDDRPFFFYFLKGADLFRPSYFTGGVRTGDPAVWILLAFGVALVGLTVVFILLPLVLADRGMLSRGGVGGPRRRATALGYFGLLGLAFITVEIALLQKFTLFLGHPAYALLVVLFAILMATSLGARLSGRIADRDRARVALLCAAGLAVACVIYAAVLGPLLRGAVAWPLFARVGLAGALVAACGVPMGVLLPSGIRLVSERDAEIVPWGWGMNGATSVIGTVGATVLALHFGFSVTLGLGGALYALAGVAALALGRLTAR
jgi:hypothetical protein